MIGEIAITSFLALSTEYRRNSYLANVIPDGEIEIDQFDIDSNDYFKGFSRNDYINNIKCRLYNFLSHSDVSYAVYNNAYNLIQSLPEIVLDKIDIENVYISSYGTVMVDIEFKSNDIFSLDIGKKSVGYFGEINDLAVCYNENLVTCSDGGDVINERLLNDAILDFLNSQNIS